MNIRKTGKRESFNW